MSNENISTLSPREFARWLWRQLTSMRTAMLLLLLLGLAAIPGSLIPQRGQNPMKVTAFTTSHPQLAAWYQKLQLFNVYSAPWFAAIYLLLFISLIGCVLPRTLEHFRLIFKSPPKAPKYLQRMEGHQVIAAPVANTLDEAKSWLRKRRFRLLVTDNSISAEKGYSRESGNLLFHLSLIFILIALAIHGLFGYQGEAVVNVGDRFINTPTSYDSLSYGKFQSDNSLTPFQLKVTDFQAKYDPSTNAPLDYKLTVAAQNPVDAPAQTKIIKVNHPLTYGNTKIYLQANGYSPVVTIKDVSGKVTFSGAVTFLPQDGNLTSIGAIKLPDMQPQIGLIGTFTPTTSSSGARGIFSSYPEVLDPSLVLSIWQGNLGLDSGTPQSVYRLDTSKMKRIGMKVLKIGQGYNFGVGTITFDGWKSWVNLQIVNDPGKDFALVGALLAVLGLLLSLFLRQRRIWIRINEDGSAEIAGLAKNAAPGLVDELRTLAAHLTAGEK